MKKIMDGNEACANKAYLFSELAAIYPITPSSPMAEMVDKMSTSGKKNLFNDTVSVIEMQSEAGAAGMVHGALQSGVLASTFTASQGLLLMLPNMYKIAGEMLPGVIHVASRSIATHALSIFGDHQDIYAARGTGFCILASSNVGDASNLAAVSHLAAIKASMPFIHFFDGFRTSHELNTIEELKDEDVLKLVDFEAINKFRARSVNLSNQDTRGMAQNEDIFFQVAESRNKDYENVISTVEYYMDEINKLTNSNYAPFVYYGHPEADRVIIAMGSVNDTVKNVIDDLNANGEKLGLVTVHLYRPFSNTHLLNVLPSTVKKIAVLDKAKEPGSEGEPLYLDVVSALKSRDLEIVGGRYGLSSKNTTPADIYAVYEMLKNNPRHNFTIGIVDDVTNLSLDVSDYQIKSNNQELLIYGFGSDGMVSASKDLIKIIGEEKKLYAQGYFEYDSKKSNGVTISNLRFSNQTIRSPYYVTHPSIVVVTKDKYLKTFDCLEKISKEGILLLNTNIPKEEIDKFLPNRVKRQILDKNIKVFIVPADEISIKYNIKGKINTIMETILLCMLGINDYEEIMIRQITNIFKSKGDDIVEANINCIKEGINSVTEIENNFTFTVDENYEKNVIELINSREGNKLKVSDLLEYKTGIFPGGNAKNEKRNLSTQISSWDKDKCIECAMCSFACPHAVIRPFILPKDHEHASYAKEMKTDPNSKFLISISGADCTSCGQCIKVCPTSALSYGPFEEDKQIVANDLFENYDNPLMDNRFTIKGSQMIKPKFEFSGACAGCGETPYIKLLTQLYGDRLLIANATGCSSIYGGSAPSTPYSIPWANSLFEDNAEFGYGILMAHKKLRNRIASVMKESLEAVDTETKDLFNKYLENQDNYEITKEVKEKLDGRDLPKEIVDLKEYIPTPSIWCIGGDGWAYDIGFGGIDHVLATNDKIKILVLDTEVYSNTGGQASKSSGFGQVAQFASDGKKTNKKDLFRIAMTYPNVYVASISLGANFMQTINTLKEAEEHDGPAIIIAYSPCIEHGISGGMMQGTEAQKLAVQVGYSLLMRYNPKEDKLTLDSPKPDFERYPEFLNNEVRYRKLKLIDEEMANKLFTLNKEAAEKRYNYYLELSQKTKSS